MELNINELEDDTFLEEYLQENEEDIPENIFSEKEQGNQRKQKKLKDELNKLNEETKQFYSSSITMRGIFLPST